MAISGFAGRLRLYWTRDRRVSIIEITNGHWFNLIAKQWPIWDAMIKYEVYGSQSHLQLISMQQRLEP
jgi:hypothetical protein